MSSLWIALMQIKGLGIKTINKLYFHFPHLNLDNIKELFESDVFLKIVKKDELREKIIDIRNNKKLLEQVSRQIKHHRDKGIEVVAINDTRYPELLKLIDDAPVALYCKGNIDLLSIHKTVAIIGTRNPTTLGVKAASRVASRFSKQGYVIVSGLADGIDTAAHIGTLNENGYTIAVLTSLDPIYPEGNRNLAKKIVEKNGLLISENPLGAPSGRQAFVLRDRIQSGLSLGVCPVQTPLKGGTQHTINYARKQNRILFCPKPLEEKEVEVTQGIYELINQGEARVIQTADDYSLIIDILEKQKWKILHKGSSTSDYIFDQKQMKLF
jgi:DNA processing protein